MKKKRMTPEQRAAWERYKRESDERLQELRDRIEYHRAKLAEERAAQA